MEPRKGEIEGDRAIMGEVFNRATKTCMFEHVMNSNWNEVIEIYSGNPSARLTPLTRWGDTAMHIAVLNGLVNVVEKLVGSIPDPHEVMDILKIENEKGNTPLHLAAAQDRKEICECIVNRVINDAVELIGVRNKNGENPLFLAARHGNMKTFLFLNSLIKPSDDKLSYCRRSDGRNILHSAISYEHFDLAYEIIRMYPKLASMNDEKGYSALRVLASKPSAFRSTTKLGRLERIIYHCTWVDPLTPASLEDLSNKQDQNSNCKSKFPPNYETSYDFFITMIMSLKILVFKFKILPSLWGRNCFSTDTENAPSTDRENPPDAREGNKDDGSSRKYRGLVPPNYATLFSFIKIVMKLLLVIFGLGSWKIEKVERMKQKHKWAFQVMEELIQELSLYGYDENGKDPGDQTSMVNLTNIPAPPPGTESPKNILTDTGDMKETTTPDATKMGVAKTGPSTEPPNTILTDTANMKETTILHVTKMGVVEMVQKIVDKFPIAIEDMNSDYKNIVLLAVEHRQPEVYDKADMKETAILDAAKMGIVEMVEKILDKFSVAIEDMNSDDKNIVLLAVEHRQPKVYEHILKRNILKDHVFQATDKYGNNALHLAAYLRDERPWLIPGAALQLQWEIKWFKYIKSSMPPDFFSTRNEANKTPREIFTDKHREMVKEGGKWLTNTSQSCSVVATLIATVAFTTAATVPGGTKQDSGHPTLEGEPAFDVFSIASLVALGFSITSLAMFLSILTSRYQQSAFGLELPLKVILGLSSLFFSIASMLVSFCAGHFFVLEEKLKYAAFPVYVVTCLPVTLFALAQLPLYVDLLKATFFKVPQRTYVDLSI